MMHDAAWLEELSLDDSSFLEPSSCSLNSEILTDVNLEQDKSHEKCHICMKVLSNVSGWREQHYAHKTTDNVVRCILCTNCFIDKNSMSVHAHFEHRNMTVKRRFFKKECICCKICGKQLSNKGNLRRHLSLFHNEGENENVLCERCGKLFISEEKLSFHNSNVHLRETCVECRLCNKKFTSQSVLNRHTRTFHPGQSAVKFKCQYCDKVLGSGFELKRHHTRTHVKVKHVCYMCGKVFFNRDYLSAHLKRHSNIKPSKFLPRKNCQNSLKVCEICGKAFSCGSALNRHIRCVHKKNQSGFKCTKCKKFFNSLGEMNTHFKRVHLKVKQSECQICNKKFFDDQALLAHLQNHLGYRPYPCPECGKAFKRCRDMKFHKKIHKDSKLCCNECGKVFRDERLLNAHSRYHTGKCKYECASCGAAFVKKASLRDHIATHSTAREFTCEHCNQAFWSQMHLYRHRRLHTEQYKCELCGKVRNSLPAFQKHVLTHLDEYRCKDCGAEFTAVLKLQEHYKGCSARENVNTLNSTRGLYTVSQPLVV